MSTPIVRQRRQKTSKEERVCSICFQTFKKAEHLARHFRSHTKEKPFRCNVCERQYTRHDTLLRHSRSHSQDVSGENVSIQDASEAVTLPMGISHIFPHTPDTSIAVDSTTLSHPLETPSSTFFSTENQECAVNHAAELEPSAWLSEIDTGWASWLTDEDFDLEAVNLSLLQASENTVQTVNDVMDQSFADFATDHLDESQPELQPSIQRTWHTYTSLEPSGYKTPPSSQRPVPINDAYRKRLAENLRQNVQHGILPSTSFLNLCMQAYFAHFHPIFPIIHASSFHPSTRNSVLLLSICSIGSLFLGSPRGVTQGTSMFERLNKAILASWDRYVSKQDSSCMTVLQASIIGQTFGFLMGRPKDLAGVEVFLGCLVSWARMAKMFQDEASEESNLIDVDSEEDLQAAWKAWISAEERKRFVLSINLLDAELAKLRHHEPTLRHFVNELPQAASSRLFAASTAEQWKGLMLESQITELTSATTTAKDRNRVRHAEEITDFERSVNLDSIAALAYERRSSENAERCRRLLISWFEQNKGHLRQNRHSRASLLMLWHSVFLVIYADLEVLERACGRDGEDVSWKDTQDAQKWANSADGVRCILHAMQIQALFEAIPVGTEPFIHVPMCLYHCGLVWFCFSRFIQKGQARRLGDSLLFPEMALVGIDRSDHDVRNMVLECSGGLQAGRAGLNKVFAIIDLLQRIVHWKIAQSFATTLLTLVESEQGIF